MTDFSEAAPPQIGEIVQANEKAPHWFRCLIIVEEIKPWGIQGFTTIPNKERGPGDAYIRLQWDEIERTGGHTIFITEEMKDAIERSTRGANSDVVPAKESDAVEAAGSERPAPAKPA